MKCQECEYRFVCYTIANKERPKKVRVNWRIMNTCGKCRNSTFATEVKDYRTAKRTVGYCEFAGMLVHRDSAICSEDNYTPMKMAHVDRMYRELNELLATKNRRTRLPKFCIKEDGE